MTSEQSADAAVTQFAVLDALLAGTYESGITVAEVRGLRDFGIGCCEELGGEVIVLDGEVFECTVGERPDPMRDDQILPFVDVCRFPASFAEPIADGNLATFTAHVEQSLVSRNLFHAVRVDGVFTALRVRVTPRQEHPYRPLAVVTSRQIETILADARGLMGTGQLPGHHHRRAPPPPHRGRPQLRRPRPRRHRVVPPPDKLSPSRPPQPRSSPPTTTCSKSKRRSGWRRPTSARGRCSPRQRNRSTRTSPSCSQLSRSADTSMQPPA